MPRALLLAAVTLASGCSGPAGQSEGCQAYARCEASLDAKNGTNLAVTVHGPNGTCWKDPLSSAACDTDCKNALAAAQKAAATNRLPGCEPGGVPYDGGVLCAAGNGGCDAHADCVETAGTVACTCQSGYSGNGTTCTALTTNPVPGLTNLGPPNVNAGSPSTTVALTGTGFAPTATAFFGTVALATTFASSSSATAVVPASELTTPGTRAVTVVNPAPGGGTSNALPFTVNSVAQNPLPVVTGAAAPAQVHAGSQGLVIQLTLTPATALATTEVVVNATAVPTDVRQRASGVVRASIPAALLASAGPLNVDVRNPAPGGGTVGAGTLDVAATGHAVPGFTALAPSSAAAGAGTLSLTLTGTGFADGGTLRVRAFPDDVVLVPSIVTPTSASVNLPAAQLADAGSFPVVFVNPGPGGGFSAPRTFTVQ